MLLSFDFFHDTDQIEVFVTMLFEMRAEMSSVHNSVNDTDVGSVCDDHVRACRCCDFGSKKFGMKEGGIAQNMGARARLLKYAEDGVPMDERRFGPTDGLRPQMINLNQCEGILIEDVTLLRSPFWVIHPLLSTDITVRGVHINNNGPNGDGCDPESCDRVLIENCYFNTGDQERPQ